MKKLSRVAQRLRQLRNPLGLVAVCLLMIGTHGCTFIGPVQLGCEDIPVTVAPGTCSAFQPPQCISAFAGENAVFENSGPYYAVIGDEQTGFQFCAAEGAPGTSEPETVPYMITGNPGRYAQGNFLVTVEGFLEATVDDSPDPVIVGSDLTYTITLTNSRQTPVSFVEFINHLPESVTLVSALPAGCILQGRDISCDDITLDPGSTTFRFVVRPNTAGTITNEFFLFDPFLSLPGTITNTTTVNPASGADLMVTVADNPDPVSRGGAMTYTITVTNNGPSTATGVRLTNRLPPLEIFSLMVSQGSSSIVSNEVVCDFGALASGASATLTYTGATFMTGTIINTATATANETDPDTANNTGSADTTVNPP